MKPVVLMRAEEFFATQPPARSSVGTVVALLSGKAPVEVATTVRRVPSRSSKAHRDAAEKLAEKAVSWLAARDAGFTVQDVVGRTKLDRRYVKRFLARLQADGRLREVCRRPTDHGGLAAIVYAAVK